MSRVKRGVTAHRRHKKVLDLTSGHKGQRHRLIKRANESMMHALRYNYVDRRDRKSDFRELWIVRINAAARLHGLNYGRFIHGLKLAAVGRGLAKIILAARGGVARIFAREHVR